MSVCPSGSRPVTLTFIYPKGTAIDNGNDGSLVGAVDMPGVDALVQLREEAAATVTDTVGPTDDDQEKLLPPTLTQAQEDAVQAEQERLAAEAEVAALQAELRAAEEMLRCKREAKKRHDEQVQRARGVEKTS